MVEGKIAEVASNIALYAKLRVTGQIGGLINRQDLEDMAFIDQRRRENAARMRATGEGTPFLDEPFGLTMAEDADCQERFDRMSSLLPWILLDFVYTPSKSLMEKLHPQISSDKGF